MGYIKRTIGLKQSGLLTCYKMCSQPGQLIEKKDVSGLCEKAKRHYSSGLESIYSLEKIDPKSIRKLKPRVQEDTREEVVEKSDPQLTLNLGEAFNGWMDSFILDEPVQELQISPHIEAILKEGGVRDLRAALKYKHLPKGYQFELEAALIRYIGKKELYRSERVRFISILRRFLGELPSTLAKEVGDAFQLHFLQPRGRRLRFGSQKIDPQELIKRVLQTEGKEACFYLTRALEQVRRVYLFPWIRGRMGLVSLAEVEERWVRIASDFTEVKKTFYFFDLLFSKKWRTEGLLQLEKTTFAVEETETFLSIKEMALSYFYQNDLWYLLDDLVRRIEREASKSWDSFREGYLEKVLTLSDTFLVYKGKSSKKEVRLNNGPDFGLG